jgi:hypothetical protein
MGETLDDRINYIDIMLDIVHCLMYIDIGLCDISGNGSASFFRLIGSNVEPNPRSSCI